MNKRQRDRLLTFLTQMSLDHQRVQDILIPLDNAGERSFAEVTQAECQALDDIRRAIQVLLVERNSRERQIEAKEQAHK